MPYSAFNNKSSHDNQSSNFHYIIGNITIHLHMCLGCGVELFAGKEYRQMSNTGPTTSKMSETGPKSLKCQKPGWAAK